MKSFGKSFQLATVALASVLALTACGGGGGGNTQAGAPGAAVSKGVITAKGSVFVNGIKYSTAGAAITVDDNPNGTENDLKIGMIVKVRGTSDDATKTGTATKIEARDALEGTIDGIDPASKTITVMGQAVRIEDNLTRLNDDDTVKVFSAAGFAVGNIVEVNGFPDDNGGLRATRVAKKTTGEFEAKGFITGFVSGATSFGLSLTPNGTSFLTVNFAAGLLPAGAANGSLVEVKSTVAPAGSAITASLIKLEDKLGAENEKVEVEGIVSSGTVANFVVNGQQVITDSSTVFEGGLSTDFAIGIKLEAEGPLNAGGAIVATKISFRSNIKIEADATNVTAGGLTVLGKSVIINSFTRFDNGVLPVNNDHIEVRVMPDRDGNLIATRIKVLGASTKAFLQGPVTASDSAAGTLTILGTTLASNSATEWRVSSSSSETPVTKDAFFAQLKANSVVKVKWDPFTALTSPIKEAEIELGK